MHGRHGEYPQGPNMDYAVTGYAHLGDKLIIIDQTGLLPIWVEGEICWVSTKYAE